MTGTFRYGFALVVGIGALIVLRASQEQGTLPTFRNRTDLLLLDVSVVDKSRRPVSGLTASDFSVVIDGKPAPVVAFKAVDVPPPEPAAAASAPWLHDVPADPTRNGKPPARIVAIVIDDFGLTGTGEQTIRMARQTALDVIDRLGPGDQAAVLFTDNAHTAETFTTDHARLRAAVRDAQIFPVGENPTVLGGCQCEVCPITALDQLALALQSVPEQRKVAFYISRGSVTPAPHVRREDPTNSGEFCLRIRRDAMYDMLRHSQSANLTIESFDPTGMKLRPIDRMGRANPFGPLEDPKTQRIEFLRTISETTGGRAVVNNNDVNLQVPAALTESGSYYLLGVRLAPEKPDATPHGVKVRVARRDVEVLARNGYYDRTANDQAIAANSAPAGLKAAVSGPMPALDFPLEMTAAALAMPDRHPAVVITLGMPLAPVESVGVIAMLLSPERNGHVEASFERRVSLTSTPADSARNPIEILARLPAAPGRYELRVGVSIGDGKAASVYSEIDVPSFEAEFAASDLMLGIQPTAVVAYLDAPTDVAPLTPTVRRTFHDSDKVTALLRIYESKRAVPVTVTTTLVDAADQLIANETRRPEVNSDPNGPGVDYLFPLPMGKLRAGEYLLTVEAAAGSKHVRRMTRFRVE